MFKITALQDLQLRKGPKCPKLTLNIHFEVLLDNKNSMTPSIAQSRHLTLRTTACSQVLT